MTLLDTGQQELGVRYFITRWSVFILPAARLKTVPLPLPQRVLNSLRCSASSFNFQYLLVSLKLSSSCVRPLLRLPFTFIFLLMINLL
jgi:hypothetical protein